MKQAKLLTEPEFKRLTAIINSLRYPTRNHTIIALSFYAGLRACEIAALRVGDVLAQVCHRPEQPLPGPGPEAAILHALGNVRSQDVPVRIGSVVMVLAPSRITSHSPIDV